MTAKKLLIPFVLASLTGHALVIGLTTCFDWTGSARPEKVITFELETPPENEGRSDPSSHEETPPKAGGDGREDSVSLRGGEKSPYDAYLLLIRRKIEARWNYPPQTALGKKAERTVIRFTIDATGALAGILITSSSGSPVLDEGTLAAVRAAAPYAPHPQAFNLTRLHITAIFNHR